MNRAMILAAFLFDGYRTPPSFVRHGDGVIDEAMSVTPGQIAAVLRAMTPQQRAFYESPVPRRAHVARWGGQRIVYTQPAINGTFRIDE